MIPTPGEVAHDRTMCQNQTYLGHEPLRQTHLPIEKGGHGLISSNSIKGAAYIGCHVLVLGRVVVTSVRGKLPSFLERLPEGPTASALLGKLKTVATKVKRGQKEDAVSTSWAALAAEVNSHGRGIWSVLVETGAERGGGRGGVDGRGGEGEGLQQQQWENPLATQPKMENELSETNRSVGGVCVGNRPRAQSKLSCALHAHRGKKRLQDLQTMDNTTMTRATVMLRAAR